jgi:hypothetical protein
MVLSGRPASPVVAGAESAPVAVEPYPRLYARLRDLLENLMDRLWEHYLLNESIESHVTGFTAMLSAFEREATRAVEGGATAGARPDLGRYVRALSAMAGPVAGRGPGRPGCVLLSDVAYVDIDTGRILENSVGTPDILYVLARDGDDSHVFAGAVYSFYERELDDRAELTTQGWPTVLRTCPPARPYWVRDFVVE